MKKLLFFLLVMSPLSAFAGRVQGDEETAISCHKADEGYSCLPDENGNVVCVEPEDEQPGFVFEQFFRSFWENRYETYLDCYKYFIDPKLGTPEAFEFFSSIFSNVGTLEGSYSVEIIETEVGQFAKVYWIHEGVILRNGYFTMRKIGHRWYIENIIPGEYNPEPPPSSREPEPRN